MRALRLVGVMVLLLTVPMVANAGSVYYERTPEVNVGNHFRQIVQDTLVGDSQIYMEIQCFRGAIARAAVITSGEVGFVECTAGVANSAVIPAPDGPFVAIVMGEGTGVLDGPGFFHILIRSD